MNRRQFFPMLIAPALVSRQAEAKAGEVDWPQWRGPDRNGISKETGLLANWPKGGPKQRWNVFGLGDGYGTVAVAGDRIYLQGARGRESVVFCLDRGTGNKLWTAALGPLVDQDRGGGPRGTPTIDGDVLYALSENGDLHCLHTKDGSAVWGRNLMKDFRGSNPHWLVSESPLVDGNKLIVTPGGPNAGMVALDKKTGKEIWIAKELSDPAGYSSCIAADADGVRAYMTLTASAGVGVRASDGKLMWRYDKVANRTANVATPVYADKKVFYTSNYGTGCVLLDLKQQNGVLNANEVYFSREMMNHHGGVVLVKGYLYGFSAAILTCLEFATGKVMWKDRSVGKGSVTYADGNLYLLGENNMAGLAKATPEGYKELGRFPIQDQGWPSWAHPVVCGGTLYLRNQGMLMSFDVKG